LSTAIGNNAHAECIMMMPDRFKPRLDRPGRHATRQAKQRSLVEVVRRVASMAEEPSLGGGQRGLTDDRALVRYWREAP
jgi:hypothetical protein